MAPVGRAGEPGIRHGRCRCIGTPFARARLVSGILAVFLLSLLPGAGNFAGAMLAELGRTSPRLLNWALHAASGIVIAIIAVELMPEVLRGLSGWWIAAAFAGGGATYMLLEWLIERRQQRTGRDRTGMWMIYIAVAVDLTSDGLMIGTGAAVSPALAMVLAAGQVLADVPEGYATLATFRDKGLGRRARIALAASFFLYVVGSALGSYFLLRGAPEPMKMAGLAFVSGLLMVAAVEDMLSEAHEAREDTRHSVASFIGGFVLFTLVSAGLDTMLGTD